MSTHEYCTVKDQLDFHVLLCWDIEGINLLKSKVRLVYMLEHLIMSGSSLGSKLNEDARYDTAVLDFIGH